MDSIKWIIVLIFFRNISGNKSEEDPDLELCEDLTVDAAVSADDGKDYIFKGEYFWQFNTASGIVDKYAKLISERWPFLPYPLDTGFMLDEGDIKGKSTVFIKGSEWYQYKGKERIDSGSTTEWIRFPKDVRIQAAFNLINVTTYYKPIFFIYKDDDYSRYIMTDIHSPQIIQIGKTWRIGRFLYFLEGYDAGTHTFQLLTDLLKLKGVLANKKHLVLFGQREYCIANITVVSPPCEQFSSHAYFKCPRTSKPGRRTTTTTTVSTTTTEQTTRLTTSEITTKKSPSLAPAAEKINSSAFKTNFCYSLYILNILFIIYY